MTQRKYEDNNENKKHNNNNNNNNNNNKYIYLITILVNHRSAWLFCQWVTGCVFIWMKFHNCIDNAFGD